MDGAKVEFQSLPTYTASDYAFQDRSVDCVMGFTEDKFSGGYLGAGGVVVSFRLPTQEVGGSIPISTSPSEVR